jgi:GTP-binding protein
MVDTRLGLTDLDQRLLALIEPRVRTGEVRLLVLLTKADKVNRRQALAALQAAQEGLAPLAGEHADIGLTLFSALTRQGLDDVATHLHAWAHPPASAARPQPAPAA